MLSKNEHEIVSPSKKNFLARGVRRALFGALRYFIDQYITLDYQIVFVNIKSYLITLYVINQEKVV